MPVGHEARLWRAWRIPGVADTRTRPGQLTILPSWAARSLPVLTANSRIGGRAGPGPAMRQDWCGGPSYPQPVQSRGALCSAPPRPEGVVGLAASSAHRRWQDPPRTGPRRRRLPKPPAGQRRPGRRRRGCRTHECDQDQRPAATTPSQTRLWAVCAPVRGHLGPDETRAALVPYRGVKRQWSRQLRPRAIGVGRARI